MSDNKNRFKALISDQSKVSNKFVNKKSNDKRWKKNDNEKGKNVFQSNKTNKRYKKTFQKNNRRIIKEDLKPNIICHGEISFMPQKKESKQKNKKKEKLKPLIKEKEDIEKIKGICIVLFSSNIITNI